MTRKCECNDWENYINVLDGAIQFASIHGFDIHVPAFRFCPYCGKELSVD